ncbi:hypothetical protein HMPREF9012_0789 [Bacteroidetes bacterium oral taxon 272 str. F0290]|nr:hypothetical protein HMPREF9012_0789 [Bacteroidetes bacterium oral taxon 272 str. F0290]
MSVNHTFYFNYLSFPISRQRIVDTAKTARLEYPPRGCALLCRNMVRTVICAGKINAKEEKTQKDFSKKETKLCLFQKST